MTTASRHRQIRLCQDVLAVLGGEVAELPDWNLAQVRAVGEATGLLPLAAHLGLFTGAAEDVAHHVASVRRATAAQVAAAHRVGAEAMAVLTEAAIPAVMVGGAALVTDVWGAPDTRPVPTVDLVVAPHHRPRAAHLVAGAATAEVGVTVHGGWTERLHGYAVEGRAVEPATFDHAALTAHVLGTLSAGVVLQEVRGVHLADVWWCTRDGVDWVRLAEVIDHADPRLAAPGLWMVHRLLPASLPEGLRAAQLARLPRRGREALHRHHAVDVLADPSQRAPLTWRAAFAETLGERKAVVQDLLRRPSPR